ncbi:MAG: glycosyl transferase [Weeksellaceae bacterium]|nr:glycosyl transferase [Bacteroidota bacterium]MCG2781449.1 glycosyl transferase [Weeksellaceae bacterium]
MKILYALQGTGNGHVSRAREIIPYLKKHGEVDVLISGTQAEVGLQEDIKYRFNGLGFVFGSKGGVDFRETWNRFHMKEFINDVKNLPVKNYDLIINDFEPVCAWSCKLYGKPSIGMSHQSAYFSDKTPQLPGFHWGKFIMNNYAPARHKVGFHFERYDDFIHTPVIRTEIRDLKTQNLGHYTVYLPAYSDDFILSKVKKIPNSQWQIFSKHSLRHYRNLNAEVFPISNELFQRSLADCEGFLTGGGFEGPAEALYLGKKLLAVPMHHQYEQQCNALGLEKMGLPVIWKENEFDKKLKAWSESDFRLTINFPDETEEIVKNTVEKYH